MNLHFKEITVESAEEMLPYYQLRPNRTCDSVFLESFIWKDFYHVRYAIWEEKALLWLLEYEGKCFSAMPLCRREDLKEAFNAIRRYFNDQLGQALVINLADEAAVVDLSLPGDQYRIEEQVDSRDYLYTGDSMRSLSGKKLHKKKNRVNAFMRQFEGRYQYRKLGCGDSCLVWEFLDKWRVTKGEDAEEHLDYEVRGIHDILKNCRDLRVRMGGVFIDGQLEAFTIGSFNPVENMAVIHIEKANPEINGLYQFINQHFLISEFPDVEWVNREDDLGLEGLRRAKMSYYPADFARKFLVEQLLDDGRGLEWAERINNTVNHEDTEYLPQEEKAATKQLWQSCFTEDSESFVSYYYEEKTGNNQILAKKQNGLVISMAQLNPYDVSFKGRTLRLDYIVGVATEESRRHRGHMGELLRRLLRDMAGKRVPFTFLMPAAAEIYLPFDFTYISNLTAWELRDSEHRITERRACTDTDRDCRQTADYMERWLGSRYDLYCRRDSAYVSRLLRELNSENGRLELLFDNGLLVGLEAFWGINSREQRLLMAEDSYVRKTGDKPAIMARITCLTALLELFHLKENGPESAVLRLAVQDSIVEENQGDFVWKLNRAGSAAGRAAADEEARSAAAGETHAATSGESRSAAAAAGEAYSATVAGESHAAAGETRSATVAGDARAAAGETHAAAGETHAAAGEAHSATVAGETRAATGEARSAAAAAALPGGNPVLPCTVSQLASWAFGYESARQIWPEADEAVLNLLAAIDRIERVFIDEVV